MLSERRPVAGPPRGVTAGGRYVGKKTRRGCGWFSLSANHRRDEPKRWLLATHNQSQTASFWLCHSLLCLAAHHSPCVCVSLSVSLLCYTASFTLTANRLPMSFSGKNVLCVMCCVSSPFVFRLNCYTSMIHTTLETLELTPVRHP